MTKYTFDEFFKIMREVYRDGAIGDGVVVYKQSNWEKEYPLEARSYVVDSENSCFKFNDRKRAMFGYSLDHSDVCDLSKQNWEIDYCYTTFAD